MTKKFSNKMKILIILIVVFILVLSNMSNYLSYDGEDEETIAKYPGADISSCTYHITTYGGEKTSTGLIPSKDFTYDATMGWYMYNYNGTDYVVLAGAHRSLIGDKDDRSNGQGKYRSWIHYFKFYDTIEFKLDGTVYKGIILDSCGAAMRVGENKSQILDIYCYDNDTITSTGGKLASLDGSTIEVSDGSSWSSSSGSSSSGTMKSLIMNTIATGFLTAGDTIQEIINRVGTGNTVDEMPITYSMEEILEDEELNEEINVVEGDDTTEYEEIIKNATLTSDWGKYSTSTSSSSASGEIFQGTTYSYLTDTQIRNIAKLCKQEQGSETGAAAEASLMANLYEKRGSKYDSIYDYIKYCGWWAHAATYMESTSSISDSYVEAVKDVLINGNRTLPSNVDEHDCFSDIKSATNNGTEINKKDRSAYISGTTIIKNRYGSTYTFYCFPTETSDPFGYTSGDSESASSTSTSSEIKEIPVIPVTSYTCATNAVDLFDIDLLNVTSDNESEIWKLVNNAVVVMNRVFLYVAAVAMITAIILNAVLMVFETTRGNPAKVEQAKKIINKIPQAIVVIIGVYLIIFLMVYLYKYAISLVVGDDVNLYPIRVNVQGTYTFNTNTTGMLRYKAVTNDASAALTNSMLYMLMVVLNLLYFIFMCIRMIIISLLILVAPLTVISMLLGKGNVKKGLHLSNILNFKIWMEMYAVFLWLPMLSLIILRVTLQMS